MKIVHFSDSHSYFAKLPKADVYLNTGDTLPNFPVGARDNRKYDQSYGRIIRVHEEERQAQWIRDFGDARRFLGNPDAPVVCVNGNHDFVDISALYSPPVFQVKTFADIFTFLDQENGKEWKFTGFEGVPPINGQWNTEMSEEAIKTLCNEILVEENTLIVTHCPPNGILDGSGPWSHYGSFRYREFCQVKRPYACFFGHVHEQGGKQIIIDWDEGLADQREQKQLFVGRTLFSNAACKINTIYL